MGMDIFSRVAIESSAPFNYSFAILGGLDAKASPCNVGDKGSIPGSGRSAGEGNSNLLILLPGKFHGWRSLEDYSPWGCKEVDTTERVHFHFSLSLFTFTFTFHFHAVEKEMASHSSALAWRTPGVAEPGGLPSVGSHRVVHD